MYFAAKFTGGVRELGRDDRRASGGAVKPGPLGEDAWNVWGSGLSPHLGHIRHCPRGRRGRRDRRCYS
eukprot:366571-Chlamydomonas_euryale.AAC.10